ncbi:hypothetical protein [Kitasatospora sp. NPDC059817]|uniref:hypothetical protein n=1 Tax=Kitasatospora sp. NPDC059817 TaxID=3346961 RepID=UPI003663A5BA
MPDPDPDPDFGPNPLANLLANALAATHYAVAAAFNTLAPGVAQPVPDDFDWRELEAFIFHLGFAADDSDAALNLYRLVTAVQRIAYREAAGRNAAGHPARLNPHLNPGPSLAPNPRPSSAGFTRGGGAG